MKDNNVDQCTRHSELRAYGRVLTPTGALTPCGYAGEYADAASGLQNLRARYYDLASSSSKPTARANKPATGVRL